MKKAVYLFLFYFIITVKVQAQQSDYYVVEEFKSKIEQFKHHIDNAITSKRLEHLEKEIDLFKNEYDSYQNIIDYALYPSTFKEVISSLTFTLLINENRLVLIEHQREQLVHLSNRITAQRTEINRLYSITDSLKTDLLTSNNNEKQLSEKLSYYRNSVKKRDNLIFQMIDSLFIINENIAFEKIEDGEIKSYSIANSENPLIWIDLLLEQIIAQTNEKNRWLDVEDYIRMYALQLHLEEVWNKVAENLLLVYGGDQKYIYEQSIRSSIEKWGVSSSKQMWLAIDRYLAYNNINLDMVNTKESFFIALQDYIKSGSVLSEKEILTTNGFVEYKKLNGFWDSTFKSQWIRLDDKPILLTAADIAKIDDSLIQWESISRPIHPMFISVCTLMFVSLLGFILVMIRGKSI
jgi:predicted acetyltransferase